MTQPTRPRGRPRIIKTLGESLLVRLCEERDRQEAKARRSARAPARPIEDDELEAALVESHPPDPYAGFGEDT